MPEDELLAGRYRIVRYLAAGGMGTVWEATDTLLAQPVALKQVTFAGLSAADAAESRRRTLREARNAARLRTEPDVIGIYDVLDVGGSEPGGAASGAAVWLVLEYLPSSSLGEVLARVGRLPVPEAARIGAAVARALAAAHRSGIVHRDVKPGNVLIAHADGRVKLTDFGISYAEGETRLTATHQLSGTPAYMAREVAAGEESTPASDVFSLASTVYRTVEGVEPFGADDNPRRLMFRVASGMLRPPESAGTLTGVLMRMLDPEPGRRPSAAAVAEELDSVAAGPTLPTGGGRSMPPPPIAPFDGSGPHREPTVPRGGPDRSRRRRGPLLVAGAAVLVALLVAAVPVRPWEGRNPDPTPAPAIAADPNDLTPVAELSVPADAVRPAGTGRAVCAGTSIAFAGAQTGSNAALGITVSNGVRLAVQEHNRANPGCQVGLKTFDTGGTPDLAPGAVGRVVAERDVVGVIGLPFSGESKATGDLFQQAGLVHITPSATNPTLTANGWTTLLRGIGNDAVAGRNAARLLTDRLHARRVCVVRDDSEYGTAAADTVERSLGSFADPACRRQVATNQTDMTSVADAVIASGADAVFYGGYYTEAAPLDAQLVARGFRGRFVGPDGVKDSEFVRLAGAAAANAYVVCPCAPSELATGFAQAYAAATGSQPGTYALEAYDAATVLLRAIDAGRRDRPGVLAAVRTNDSVGLAKRMRWGPTGDPDEPPVFAYRVLDGQITFVGRVTG